jgi:hypothetical protein
MTDSRSSETLYFSYRDLGLIFLVSVLAAITGATVPSYLFPEGKISDLVYGAFGLPGPGAGVLIFGGILCFWLVLGLILVKKPGTAIVISILIIALDLLFGEQAITIQVLDVLLFVAIIIELVCLLPVDRKPWSNIMPALIAALSVITLALAVLGLARLGESDILTLRFPTAYCVAGILGLLYAVICWRYPVKYLVAAGIANMYYMLHFWLFWGEGFASRFPQAPDAIPVLLLIALLGGVIFASAAWGIELVMNRCRMVRCKGDQ